MLYQNINSIYLTNIHNILSKSNSWEDFHNSIKSLPKKSKGDAFEELTYYFLKLIPEYSTLLQNVWKLKDIPDPERKKLNLPNRDEGIDLVAKTNYGEYWAIQCKYREDETKSLTRKDLSTFTDLTFGICNNFSLALVCTTADRFSYKLKHYQNRISFCAGDKWRELDKEFFLQLHRHLRNLFTLPKPLKPRPHQTRAIKNAQIHFIKDDNSRGKLIMPCGTGKSLTAFWIAHELKANKILIAVPSLSLIQQTLATWTRESIANKKNINWICVCSDESVSKLERVDIAVLTQDLGIRVHSNPDEIADWLQLHKTESIVVITTYQSGKTIANAVKKANINFDLGILDEAHKTVGKKDSLFSHLIYNENISIIKRIFMTATERRYIGQSDQIASMDNPKLYGETFELLSFKTALECSPAILSDYKIVTVVVTRKEIRKLINEKNFIRPDNWNFDKEVEAQMLASAIALRKTILKTPIKHAVSFHSSISKAIAFKETQNILTSIFPEYGELETFHVSGSIPTSIRKRKIDQFEASSCSLITNARCLNEGVDVPNIDCILFADPRKSIIDIVQAIGRALRPSPEKEKGYIIVPVILDFKDELEQIPDPNSFDTILSVLRALATNDERIIEYFRSKSRHKKQSEYPDIFESDIPIGLEIDTDRFIESIELKYWSRLAKLSWRPFKEALIFSQTLNLSSISEWRMYCRGELPGKEQLPKDISSRPDWVYRTQGWSNWGDWLGSGTIATQQRVYKEFELAREFARNLDLKNLKDWFKFCKGEFPEKGILPEDIPANPNSTYSKSGWISFGDWLGTLNIASQKRIYRDFNDSRTYARSLLLNNVQEWRQFCKGEIPEKGNLPEDIPVAPYRTYKDKGWINFGDWLGTGRIASQLLKFRNFVEAREYVHNLNLKSQAEWTKFSKGEIPEKGALPNDIPSGPSKIYHNKGWTSWGDWLGSDSVAFKLKKYRSFEEARIFARKLGLKSSTEWQKYIHNMMPEKGLLPDDIPMSPDVKYKNHGWQNWGDWLGTGILSPRDIEYRSFSDARKYIKILFLKSAKEWQKFCKGEFPDKGSLPPDIPARPDHVYRNKGWEGWSDWLGK